MFACNRHFLRGNVATTYYPVCCSLRLCPSLSSQFDCPVISNILAGFCVNRFSRRKRIVIFIHINTAEPQDSLHRWPLNYWPHLWPTNKALHATLFLNAVIGWRLEGCRGGNKLNNRCGGFFCCCCRSSPLARDSRFALASCLPPLD